MKLQSEFSREFFKNNFRPFAAPSKCRPVRPAPPRYTSARMAVLITVSLLIKSEVSSFTHSEDVIGSPTCTEVTNNRLR